MTIKPNESAIVLIEFQKQWTQNGPLYRLIKRQLQSREVLNTTRAMVDSARGKGIRIVHAPLIIDPFNKKGLYAHITFGKLFTKDSWKSALTDGLYKESDSIIKGRYAFDAFTGSDLDILLRENGIQTLFLCGFITDQCVAKTMKTAISKGFTCYLISDCTATFNGLMQRRTENSFRGKVVNHRDVMLSIQ